MKIAFLHYHLKPGGVTTVLKQQLAAVERDCEILVLSGMPLQPDFPAEVVLIPELSYSDVYGKRFAGDAAATAVLNAIHHKFGGPCDILHVHNPTLAKNRQMPDILNSLQQRGVKLLLQIHDFAEDGRPLYYFEQAYPSDCHYGVINERDYRILLDAGLKPEGLHRMVNAVNPPQIGPGSPKTEEPVVYAIRAIRRKNIGEAILLSLFFRSAQTLAVTLPPNSPADIASYRDWKAFVKSHRLKVEFESGLNRDFHSLMASADFLITTSVSEGFGFSFLEPWLFEKLLWGRKLPDICREFETNGVGLDHLYTDLRVPVDWIGLEKFRRIWTACVSAAGNLFNVPMSGSRIHRAFEFITRNGRVDFGILDEPLQKKVIRRLISDSKNAEKLIRLNPFLDDPGRLPDADGLIEKNRRAICNAYHPAVYRQTLLDAYRQATTTPVTHTIDKTALATAFLTPERFSLLTWREYEKTVD